MQRYSTCTEDGSDSFTDAASSATVRSCPIQAAVETAAAIASATSSSTQRDGDSKHLGSTSSVLPKHSHIHPKVSGNRNMTLAPSVNTAPIEVAAVQHVHLATEPIAGTAGPSTDVSLSTPAHLAHQYLLPQQHQNCPQHYQQQQQHRFPTPSTVPIISLPAAPVAFPSQTLGPHGPHSVTTSITTIPLPVTAQQVINVPALTPGMMFLPSCQIPGVSPVVTAAVQGTQTMGMTCVLQQNPQLFPSRFPLSQTIPYSVHAQMLKRRAGKWTLEEEEYAAVLIEMFEKGQVTDEKNGVTLRAFLSRKLFCAPMRISKKYAGKGIGKKVFMSKINPSIFDPTKPQPPGFDVNIARMKQAEGKFLSVAFPELQAALFPYISGPFVSNAYVPLISNGALSPLTVNVAPTIQTVPQPIAPKIGNSLVDAAPVTHQVVATSVAPFSNFSPAAASENSTALLQQRHVVAIAPKSDKDHQGKTEWKDQTNNIVDGQIVAPKIIFATQPAGNVPRTNSAERLCLPSPAAAESSASRVPSAVHHLHEAYLNSVLNKATSVSTDQNTSIESKVDRICHIAKSEGEGKSTILQFNGDSSQYQDGIPDFLSGFDKMSGRMEVDHHAISEDFGPYSPTYTTESFDDLHQFLGKDLTPLTTERLAKGSKVVDVKDGKVPVMPGIQSASLQGSKKRIAPSNFQVRPLKSRNSWRSSNDERDATRKHDKDQSVTRPSSSGLNHTTGSYSIYTQETAEAVRRNGFFQDHDNNFEFKETQLQMPSQQLHVNGLPGKNPYLIEKSEPLTIQRFTSSTVSDPSDLASDDLTSGNDSGNFCDSDETNSQSEGSNRLTKRDEMYYGGDDDVQSWYKTLIQD
ncbi:hypothetical protein IV203_035886 [Nitzschia inconspicua]|uniref:Uncharacterized protein n=1 Tax=Nitzschia inconspicua TaxID=303405 RepID=A0A9K3LER8_9STRA|nr:hypothetical protein IV203_035886 [Nitzschia inconspicua]